MVLSNKDNVRSEKSSLRPKVQSSKFGVEPGIMILAPFLS